MHAQVMNRLNRYYIIAFSKLVVGTAVGAAGPMLAAVWLAHDELLWDPMLGIV